MPNPSTIPTNTAGDAVKLQIDYRKHDHDYDGDRVDEVIPAKRQKLCTTETSYEFRPNKCLGPEPVTEDHGTGLQNTPEDSSVLFGTSERNQEAKSTLDIDEAPTIDANTSESDSELKITSEECDCSIQSTLEEKNNLPDVGETQEAESKMRIHVYVEEAPTFDVITSELCLNPKTTSEEYENLQSTFEEKHILNLSHFEKDTETQNLDDSDVISVVHEGNDFQDKNEKKRSDECMEGEIENPAKRLKIISAENHETFASSAEALEMLSLPRRVLQSDPTLVPIEPPHSSQGQSTLIDADKPEFNLATDNLLSGKSNNTEDSPKLSQTSEDMKVMSLAVPTEPQHITQGNSTFIDADTPEFNPTKTVKLLSSANSSNNDFSKLPQPPEDIKVPASSKKIVKFPENLTQEQAIHILHFLHSYPGTSVLLVVILSNTESEFDDETIFIKMYKNKDMPGGVKKDL